MEQKVVVSNEEIGTSHPDRLNTAPPDHGFVCLTEFPESVFFNRKVVSSKVACFPTSP